MMSENAAELMIKGEKSGNLQTLMLINMRRPPVQRCLDKWLYRESFMASLKMYA